MQKPLLNSIAQSERFICLDWFNYGQRVILGGKPVPWTNTAELCHFMGQGQQLLDLDLQLLPLGSYFDWWLDKNGATQNAMAGKRRLGFALKTFLANTALRADLEALVRATSQASQVPLALQLPATQFLLPWAHARANGHCDMLPDATACDSANVYIADFLRQFAALDIAAIVFDDSDKMGDALPLSLYQSVANICDGYGWTLVLHQKEQAVEKACADILLAEDTSDDKSRLLADEFWLEGVIPDKGKFTYGQVPPGAQPETVLQRLTLLR